MELKKSKEANLENKKKVFFVVGLTMISAVVLMAFTATTAEIAEKIAEEKKDNRVQDELVFEIPPEQPEPPQQQEQAPPPPDLEKVEVVEDDEEIEKLDLDSFEDEQLPTDDEEEEEIKEEAIVDFAEVDPVFPGGEVEMQKFIRDNFVYPELSKEMGEQGTVYVQFVVNTDGSIQDVVVVKGVSDLIDKEAVRVVKRMPKWTPGEQAGKNVRVRYTVPINCRIG